LNKVDYANTFYRDFNDADKALNILGKMRMDFLKMESIVKTSGFNNKIVKKGEWTRWQKAYPEIVSSLIYIYRKTDRLQEAEIILSEWVDRNPTDQNAKDILNEVRSGG